MVTQAGNESGYSDGANCVEPQEVDVRYLKVISFVLLAICSCKAASAQNSAIASRSTNSVIYVDGVTNTTLSEALSHCPTATPGCVIDMRANSSPTALNLGVFDPGATPVTILLGPFGYKGAFTLRNHLTVLGSNQGSTTITQTDASIPIFALPTSGSYPGIVAQGVHIGWMTLNPMDGSTSDAISLVAAPNGNCTPQPACQASNPGGGIWYSSFEHIYIQPGFGRNGIRIDGTQAGSPTSAMQFASFRDIWAFRKTNGPPVLYVTGPYIGQIEFNSCEFDQELGGADSSPDLENIYIDDAPGLGAATWVPYSITFTNLTSQWADGPNGAAIRIKGGQNISFDNPHFEDDLGIVDATIGPGGHSSHGIVLSNPYIVTSAQASLFPTCKCVPAASGFIAHSDGHSAITITDGTFQHTPDNFFTGTPTYVTILRLMNDGNGFPEPVPGILISELPNAAYALGQTKIVRDSTAIARQGQTCAHASKGAVNAKAWSDGSVWHCSN